MQEKIERSGGGAEQVAEGDRTAAGSAEIGQRGEREEYAEREAESRTTHGFYKSKSIIILNAVIL